VWPSGRATARTAVSWLSAAIRTARLSATWIPAARVPATWLSTARIPTVRVPTATWVRWATAPPRYGQGTGAPADGQYRVLVDHCRRYCAFDHATHRVVIAQPRTL